MGHAHQVVPGVSTHHYLLEEGAVEPKFHIYSRRQASFHLSLGMLA